MHAPFSCPLLCLFACHCLKKPDRFLDKPEILSGFSIFTTAHVWQRPNQSFIFVPQLQCFGHIALGKANPFLKPSCRCIMNRPSHSESSHWQSSRTQLSLGSLKLPAEILVHRQFLDSVCFAPTYQLSHPWISNPSMDTTRKGQRPKSSPFQASRKSSRTEKKARILANTG